MNWLRVCWWKMFIIFCQLLLLASRYTDSQRIANVYKQASVAADGTPCSQIGTDILRKNGSAVDSYIASVFCLGVYHPMSSGLGGGGVSLVYVRAEKKFYSYDYFGYASENADEKMFERTGSETGSRYGPLAMVVPGQLKGLWAMHQNHGWLPWSDLIEPSIKMAEAGVRVDEPLAGAMGFFSNSLHSAPADPCMRSLLLDSYGRVKAQGELHYNAGLVKTLRNIQTTNITSFYQGEMASKMVAELRDKGGILTENDFNDFQVKQRDVLQTDIQDNLKLTTVGAPFSGALVTHILSIVSGFDFSNIDLRKTEDAFVFYQRFIEAAKFAMSRRDFIFDPDFIANRTWMDAFEDFMTNSNIADRLRNFIRMDKTHEPDFYGNHWTDDREFGTSHVSVLAENGDAVSGTNTINYYFGALVCSEETGVIFNNAMNDFADQHNLYHLPPSKWNKIEPHKRPSSSMSPTIITDKEGDVSMVIGASGGPRIPMAIAEVIGKHLFTKMELGEAIESYRVYHTGLPENTIYNYMYRSVPTDLIQRFTAVGHRFQQMGWKGVVQAIRRWPNGMISSASDQRKYAESRGY